MIRRRDFVARLAGAGALALAPRSARAAVWPARPIGVVVPYPPGGSTDITARIVGERLSVALGQPLVIDNRSGGAATSGWRSSHARRRTATRSASLQRPTPST